MVRSSQALFPGVLFRYTTGLTAFNCSPQLILIYLSSQLMLIYLSLFLCTHNLSLGDCNLVVAVPPDSEDISPCELFLSISYGLIHFYKASIIELFATLEDRTIYSCKLGYPTLCSPPI